jgi:hypothetical protein
MRTKPGFVIVLLVMTGTVASTYAAATAGATQCTSTGPGTTICQRPGGSTSINSSPTQVGPVLPGDCYLAYLDPLCDDSVSGITFGRSGITLRSGR